VTSSGIKTLHSSFERRPVATSGYVVRVELVPFLVALVGLGIAAVRGFQLLRMGVDTETFGAILEKCLRMRDPEKGRKICAAAFETPLAAATTTMLEIRELPRGTSEDDARSTLRDAFIRSFEEKAAPIAAYRFASWVALALLALPVVHGYFAAVLATPLVVVSIVGLALLGWTARSAAKTLAGGPCVLDRLLPHAVPLLLDPVSTYRSPETADVDAPAPKRLPPDLGSVVLVIDRDGTSEGTQTFEQPIIKIGRAQTAHLQLDDEAVGRMHAVIERDAEGVTIIDLGSESGTRVNGETVNKARLSHGDIVEIGPYRLTVGIGAQPSPVVAERSRETEDPKTWGHLAAILYGFEHRSPDLFYEVVGSCIANRARIAKVRRRQGSPRFVVAVLADGVAEIAATRRRIEKDAPSLYPSYATPAADIAPDSLYGPETLTHGKVLAEIVAGETEVLATRTVTVRRG
jgi:pSer/pThr/pTyr-binding forkhead associated (FHA) protein